jgi:hypothetical protein
VLDISMTGAGLVLFGPWVEMGSPVLLELQVDDGPPNGVRLEAAVRNIGPTPDVTVRVGLEFTSLKAVEAKVLASLLDMATAASSEVDTSRIPAR